MRLLCNGKELELADGSSLTFKKQNVLFAFDNMSCERTVSFDIPATPVNDAILGLSRLPELPGEGMRRKFDAILEDGLVQKSGYIYVGSYKGGKYSAIFVSGELVQLQRLKDLGKISDILKGEGMRYATEYGAQAIRPVSGYTFGNVLYHLPYTDTPESQVVMPSVGVGEILGLIQYVTGVRMTTSLPGDVNYQRLVLTSLNPFEEISARYTAVHHESYGTDQGYNQYGTTHDFVLEANISSAFDWLVSKEQVQQEWVNENGTKLYAYPTMLTAKTTLAVTFPDDFPDDYYVIADPRVNTYMTFLGGYSFSKVSDYSIQRYGEPLAGRTIIIPKGQTWLVVTDEHYRYSYNAMRWKFTSSLEPFTLGISGGEEINKGDTVVLANNLPEVSVVEFLHAIAATTGRVLSFSAVNGVQFDSVNLASFSQLDITDRVISRDELTRKFSDYAQHNIIKTKQSEWVRHFETADYRVDNDNLEAEKELLTIPFSEANAWYNGVLEIRLPYTDKDGNDIKGEEEVVLASYYEIGKEHIDPSWPEDEDEWTDEMWEQWFRWLDTSDQLKRITFPLNAGIKSLCDASTSLTLKARLTLQEYESITEHTAILYAGTRYVWTEAQYSKGVVTLKLSKIPA